MKKTYTKILDIFIVVILFGSIAAARIPITQDVIASKNILTENLLLQSNDDENLFSFGPSWD